MGAASRKKSEGKKAAGLQKKRVLPPSSLSIYKFKLLSFLRRCVLPFFYRDSLMLANLNMEILFLLTNSPACCQPTRRHPSSSLRTGIRNHLILHLR